MDRIKKHRLHSILLFAVLSLYAGGLVSAAAAAANPLRLDSNIYDDWSPQISDGKVAWQGHDSHDWEIYLNDGTKTMRLTDNGTNDTDPHISQGQVAWVGRDGGDGEIYLYRDGKVIRLTDNDFEDRHPRISSGRVVWQGGPAGSGDEIFLYDGANVSKLTDNDYADTSPEISDGKVAWQGRDGPDTEVFFFNGTSVRKLTDNDFDDSGPRISGANVAWEGWDGSDFEIFLFDGTNVRQLTNNAFQDRKPEISGRNVAWYGWRGLDNEIFAYKAGAVRQLTDNATEDWDPKISGENVVWYGSDGSDLEIFVHNGRKPMRVTSDSHDDEYAVISGDHLAWENHDGTDDDIYGYRLDTARPAAAISAPGFASTVSRTKDFDISWSASDPFPSAGIQAFDVEYKVAPGGNWTDFLNRTSSTSARFWSARGATYVFRAKAIDRAGYVGGWSRERKTAVPYDQRALDFSGAWRLSKDRRYYYADSKYAVVAGARATRRFADAKKLVLLITKRKNGGYANVYINNRKVKTIDFHAPATRFRVPVNLASSSTPFSGRLKVIALGRHSRASTGNRVEIDGLSVVR